MKNYIICYLLLPFYLFAQKNDNHWIISKKGNNFNHPQGGLVNIEFLTDSLHITKLYPDNFITEECNTSISDNTGNLLFYTNGLTVFHAQHDTMQGSKDFNKGVWYYDGHDTDLSFRQSVVILPHPIKSNLYYLFHKNPNLYDNTNSYFQAQFLQYSVVDIQQDSGRGAMIQKNIPIIDNEWICGGYLTACKHANGKDWWLITPKLLQNKYYLHLFTGDSIYNMGSQNIGLAGADYQQGMAHFTPDGTKYILGGATANKYTIFDFDRCTGLLSNYRTFTVTPPAGDATWGNLAISPNSRYLYIVSQTKIFQYDLSASDILASQQLVAAYDGYICTYPGDNTPYGNARFFTPQLAPNGKIYICSYGATDVYTVINQPDSAGMACDVQQHALDFNKLVSYSIPNFPNYRLGASATPCYGVSNEEEIGNKEIAVYPNPATQRIYIETTSLQGKGELLIYNALGQAVYSQKAVFSEKETEIYIGNLPKGAYFLRVVGEKGGSYGKFFKE